MCCSFFERVVLRVKEILEDPPPERPYFNIQSSRKLESPKTRLALVLSSRLPLVLVDKCMENSEGDS